MSDKERGEMTITELVRKLIGLGWYVARDVYINSSFGDDGMAMVALPAMNGKEFLHLPGWPLFTHHPIFNTWSGSEPATQASIDWLKQAVAATEREDVRPGDL